ncbi:hypothetical protein NH44784_028531 [Achromobacter xylosoxidans NH44784-1996]|nr:hypothetical protein NH44784_028531 [Achromobacter xylosoxidans NH44784-1996]
MSYEGGKKQTPVSNTISTRHVPQNASRRATGRARRPPSPG